MKFLLKRKELLILILLIVMGGFLRFYNLNWDQGYLFHPDETNNIAVPAAHLKFPFKPEQFTYGSLTIYLYRLGASFFSFITGDKSWVEVAGINLVGRFISAALSTFLIFLIYFLGKRVGGRTIGLLTAFFVSFNIGLIQAAHFGTTETILTLAGILLAFSLFSLLKGEDYQFGYLGTAAVLGLASAAKISVLIFFPVFLFSHVVSLTKKNFLKRNFLFFTGCLLLVIIFFIISPYSFLAFSDFWTSLKFERNIASGKIPMFFTGQFLDTPSYLFQITKVFPWILSWPVLFLGFLGSLLVFYQGLRKFNKEMLFLFILPVFYFLYTGSLFVKWTRYMIPLVPFFCLFAAFALIKIYQNFSKIKLIKLLVTVLIIVLVISQVFYGLAFFNIYRQPDPRIRASEWIYQNLPSRSELLLEPLDVVALPVSLKKRSPIEYRQIWFDFYGMDEAEELKKAKLVEKLSSQLATADYIIIGSRRLYANRLRLKNKYPLTAKYYTFLFNGALGFEKIKQFSSYPKILGAEINDDEAEETFQVFDHPKVLIFQNVLKLPSEVIKNKLTI